MLSAEIADNGIEQAASDIRAIIPLRKERLAVDLFDSAYNPVDREWGGFLRTPIRLAVAATVRSGDAGAGKLRDNAWIAVRIVDADAHGIVRLSIIVRVEECARVAGLS